MVKLTDLIATTSFLHHDSGDIDKLVRVKLGSGNFQYLKKVLRGVQGNPIGYIGC
jgi:hypothetical protein